MIWLVAAAVIVLIIVLVYFVRLTRYRLNARRANGDSNSNSGPALEAQQATQTDSGVAPTFSGVARDITGRMFPDRRPSVDPATGEMYVPFHRRATSEGRSGLAVHRVTDEEAGVDPDLPSYNDRTATTHVPVPNLPAEPPAAYQSTTRSSRESDATFIGDEPPKYDPQPVVKTL